MTYDVNDTKHHRHPLINALPGAVGTHLVFATLSRGVNWLAHNQHRRGNKHRRDAGKLLRALRQNLRVLFRLERHNFSLWLRRALAGSAAWRASVLCDLGGERALRRWERRNTHRHKSGKLSARPGGGVSAPQKGHAAPGRSKIKTDASGFFRLAVIKRKSCEAAAGNSGFSSNTVTIRSGFSLPDFKPVGLTPDELRGQHDFAPVEPADIPADPHVVWDALQAPLMDVAAKLDALEAAIENPVRPCGDDDMPDDGKDLPGPDDARANHKITHPD